MSNNITSDSNKSLGDSIYGASFKTHPLIIRQCDRGRFLRNILCNESSLSVITSYDESFLSLLKDGILNGGVDDFLEIKIGERNLYPSEVFRAGKLLSSCKYKTVYEVIVSLGYPKEGIPLLLEKLGLDSLTESPFGSLTQSEKKRLLLIGALSAKNKVVYFENPFKDIERQWIPPIASLIEETASNSVSQYYVVVDVEVVPSLWERSESVQIEVIGDKKRRASSFGRSGSELSLMVSEIRNSLKENTLYLGETDSRIISRPQNVHSVYDSHVMRSTTSEIIVNPSLSEALKHKANKDESYFDLSSLRAQTEKLGKDKRFTAYSTMDKPKKIE